MAKRIMRKFRMSEISAVDRPAQSPALVTIMKNDDIAKAAFQEALGEMKTERKVSEALSEMWDLNYALRESIEMIVGDKETYPDTQAAVEESLMEFSSAVATMIAGATGEIAEAVEGDDSGVEMRDEEMSKGVEYEASDFAYVPDPEDLSLAKMRLTTKPGELDARNIEAAIIALGQDVIPDEGLSIAKANVRDAWLNVNPDKTSDELPEILKGLEEEDTMKDKNTPTIEDVQKNLDEANARADKAEALASMNDLQKAYYDGLDEDKQAEFIKMDDAARTAAVEVTKAEDPVVYTSTDGEDFRKSDDPRLVKMAKQADADRKERNAEIAKRENLELTKRAEDELDHLPGDADVKVSLLKAVNGIEDEDIRGKVTEMLKSHNTSGASAFETLGTTIGKGKDKASATQALDNMAKAYQEEHKNVSAAQAYDAVIQTDEGQALYEQTL